MTTRLMPCMGDSLISHRGGTVRASFSPPSVLAQLLSQRAGLTVWENNLGIPGDTSAQMLARFDATFAQGTPDLLVVYGGTNDGSSGTTIQANLQAMIKAARFRALGLSVGGPSAQPALLGTGATPGVSVATVSALPATARPGSRFVVLSDTDTTGGQAADPALVAQGGRLPTITGTVAGSGQAVWECRNPRAGAYGWGRVAVTGTSPFRASDSGAIGCPRIVVVARHFGLQADTTSVQDSTSQTQRAAQAAAVAAEAANDANGRPTVILADLYAYMRTMIVGGTVYGQTFAAGSLPNFTADSTIVGRVAYDPLQSPQLTPQVGTLSGATTAGATSIPTTATIASGTPIVLDYGTGSQESVWATGASSGTAVAVTATANAHSSGATLSTPNLHFNEYGAYLMARCIADAIASQAPGWLTALA